MMTDIFSIHKKLCAGSCGAGFEASLSASIKEIADKNGFETRLDPLGSLICRKKGKGVRVLVSSHMDSPCFMVKNIDDRGFLRVTGLGIDGKDLFTFVNSRLISSRGTHGVLRICAHAETVSKPPRSLTLSDLYIDMGASSRESAQNQVQTGDLFLFEGAPELMANGRVLAPSLGGLLGCAVMLAAMGSCRKAPNDLCFVFSAQGGLSPASSAAASFAFEPDIALVCGVSQSDEKPRLLGELCPPTLALGRGPAVTLKTGGAVPQTGLMSLILKAASIKGIPCQKEISERADAGLAAHQSVRSGVSSAGITVPVRAHSSAFQIYDLSDAENAANLLAAFLHIRL